LKFVLKEAKVEGDESEGDELRWKILFIYYLYII